MKTLLQARDQEELRRRLRALRPDNAARWGRMSAHQMVCHLHDAFLMGTERKPVSDGVGLATRTVIKWIALYAPLSWPQGVQTRPEIDQVHGTGTGPTSFDADVASLAALIEVASTDPEFFARRRHPIFGPLSKTAWMRWAYLHTDHHLRQFGV